MKGHDTINLGLVVHYKEGTVATPENIGKIEVFGIHAERASLKRKILCTFNDPFHFPTFRAIAENKNNFPEHKDYPADSDEGCRLSPEDKVGVITGIILREIINIGVFDRFQNFKSDEPKSSKKKRDSREKGRAQGTPLKISDQYLIFLKKEMDKEQKRIRERIEKHSKSH